MTKDLKTITVRKLVLENLKTIKKAFEKGDLEKAINHIKLLENMFNIGKDRAQKITTKMKK